MKKMAQLCVSGMLFVTASCGHPVDVPLNVTSRAPNATFACIAPKLERLPVRTRTRSTTDGWQMDLLVYAGPPAGWYRKGTLEHASGVVLFAPDGATAGIADQQTLDRLRPILRRCSGR